jgi:hypothetical protein
MGKNPAELQTYGDVCFNVMGTRVRQVIEEPRGQLQAYGSTHIFCFFFFFFFFAQIQKPRAGGAF